MILHRLAAMLLFFSLILAVVYYIIRCFQVLSYNSPLLSRPNAKRLIIAALLRSASLALIILSLTGVSRHKGSTTQENTRGKGEAGDAISFVFDISYSMNAQDAGGGIYKASRLEAAIQFARMMVGQLGTAPISAVLAKGGGIIAVPLTADKEAVNTLLSSLSPALMSAAGTHLGAGIEAAEKSFPRDVAYRRNIWLFTDGDETDGALLSSVKTAAMHGANVMLVGFGSKEGCEVIAGDGKTKVHSSLESEKLKDIAISAEGTTSGGEVRYIGADSMGAAALLLSILMEKDSTVQTGGTKGASSNGNSTMAFWAVIIFIVSIIVKEVRAPVIRFGKIGTMALLSIILAGCSTQYSTMQTLKGAWAWHQGQMQKAVAAFLRVLHNEKQSDNKEGEQYALYNIASTYISLGEYDASLSSMDAVTDDAPSAVKYAASYNRGIIAFSRGEYDKAADCFRKALIANNTSIPAKKNLEIANDAIAEIAARKKEKTGNSGQAAKSDRATEVIFERVREQDKKQWISLEQGYSQQSSADY